MGHSLIKTNDGGGQSLYSSLQTQGQGCKEFSCHTVIPGIELARWSLTGESFAFSHRHHPHELIFDFCVDGRIGWTMGTGEILFAGKDDFIIHNAQSCANSKVRLPLGFYSGISLCFNLDLLNADFLRQLDDTFTADILINRFCTTSYSRSFKAEACVTGICRNLNDAKITADTALLKLSCCSILAYLFAFEKFSHQQLKLSSQLKLEKIKKLGEFLLNNLGQRITITELSGKFALNPTSLQAAFKEIFGKTVDDFVQDARMRRATELLADETVSVKDVAAAVGYANQGKFGSAFKRYTGMTPLVYKKKAAAIK